VLALGGGVVGDLAGFGAATYLRGVRWACLPTTLLAMVDASLGGKTGADLPQGKNLVGAFHAPAFVLADPQVLDTLPEAEFRSGLAEVVKHGVIADPKLFGLCSQGWDAVQSKREEIIRRAIAVKVQIIKEDPFEGGRRAALNLGHTLGHAVEQASGFRLKHGEAVAIGTVFAARLSRSLGVAQEEVPEAITETLNGLGLPVDIPAWIDREQIRQFMGFDKKKASGRLRWVLPVRIGEVVVGAEIDDPLQYLPV
jgi:3-dehydroquinate synthase